MSYLPYQKSLEKYGSMGIAIPGGKFTLIDVNGEEITTPDVVGELVYQGANVMLGYAEQGGDLRKGDELGGILVTGDMAKRDTEGFYYIVGRKKRFLKIFGNRVNLDETERLIKAEFDIDCACAGVDDKMTIFIAGNSDTGKIKKFISEKTGLNAVAFFIKTISEIPKNEAGKTLYSKLEV
jgi:acyl-CoA synthetase (AMP-forming)/AMP-acid ligase II